MRPGQNKRMRGRNNNNNNRKGPNPLTRSYESNGPDVKIRGTAHHVGEKYLQLARDAHSSGDPVRAESYLQHAEHYFRVIATAQQAQQAQFGYGRQPGDAADLDDDGDDDEFGSIPDRFASPSERPSHPPQQQHPQPERQPFNDRQSQAADRGGGQPYGYGERQNADRPNQERFSHERGDRGYDNRNGRSYDNRNGHDRGGDRGQGPGQGSGQGYGGDRNGYDRGAQQDRGGRDDRSPRDYDNRSRGPRPFRPAAEPRQPNVQPSAPPSPAPSNPAPSNSAASSLDEPVNDLPAFITGPTRVAPEAGAPEPVAATQPAASGEAGDEAGLHLRPRRRRRPKVDFAGDAEDRAETPAVPDPIGD